MRSLAQPSVILRAAVAAVITALLCYPRLAIWTTRPQPLLFACLILLWASFVLWSFVFAWHFKYSGRPVLAVGWQPRLWAWATLYGIAAAIFLRYCIDPRLRVASPDDYPTTMQSGVAMALFSLAFDPLFLCFAPFAFFIRLARNQNIALILTIAFGVFILYLKPRTPLPLPPWWVFVDLARTITTGYLTLQFYLRGGAWLVWWPVLLTQLRHLIAH